MAFPEATEVERRTAFLEEEELARAEALAAPAVRVEQPVVTHYVGWRDGTPLGVAYFDAHRVRTLPEVLMVVVDPEGRVARIEVLKFTEPQEYRPPDGWLRRFRGESRIDRISTDRDIVNMTGATLSSRAVTRAVRRVLALHRLISPLSEGAPGPGKEGGSARADSARADSAKSETDREEAPEWGRAGGSRR